MLLQCLSLAVLVHKTILSRLQGVFNGHFVMDLLVSPAGVCVCILLLLLLSYWKECEEWKYYIPVLSFEFAPYACFVC